MVAILGFSKDQITAAVQAMYAEVAVAPTHPFHFPVGRAGAKAVGYPDAELDRLPPEALASFAGVGDRGLRGVVAVVGALAACYGTMALLALLSLLGISITLDPGLWAATIVGAAILAVVATAFNLTRHRQPWPLVVAGLGAATIGYAMFGTYDPMVEGLGFAALKPASSTQFA